MNRLASRAVALLLTLEGLSVNVSRLGAVTPTAGLSAVRARLVANVEADPSGTIESMARGDFNHDGADDLAVGLPWSNGATGAQTNQGMVLVRFGVPGQGLVASSPVVPIHQGDSYPYAANNNRFGWAVAAGDFNGDGYDDLAVSSPGYYFGVVSHYAQGLVQIHFGRSWGIDPAAGQVLANDVEVRNDFFGEALAAGDFDGNGIDDLAIGSPRYKHWQNDQWVSGGTVWVMGGTSSGLDQGFEIAQDDGQIPDEFEEGDEFGYSLAAGNFNGDWRFVDGAWHPVDDLAIGSPMEDDVGAVMILFGSQWNLLFGSAEWWGEWHLRGTNQVGNRFTRALAAGDFDGDGSDDLAIGAPLEAIGPGNSVANGGAVTLIYGTNQPNPYNFDLARTEYFDQGTGTGIRNPNEQFGRSLAAGDFNGDGAAEIAIGRPYRDVVEQDRGAITVIDLASSFGLGWAWSDLAPGIGGVPGAQENSSFGYGLVSGNFDGDGEADLAVGFSNFYASQGWVGAEVVLYGALFADGFECGCTGYWVLGP